MLKYILTIQFISMALLLSESAYIYLKTASKLHTYLFLFTFAAFIDNFGYYLELKAVNLGDAFKGIQVSYLGKVVVTLSFLVFVLEYIGEHRLRKLYIPLVIFHGLTFFAVLTSDYHKLFYRAKAFVRGGLFNHCILKHGPWFYIYMFVLFIYIITGLTYLISAIIKEENANQKQRLKILLGAGSMMAVCYFLYVIQATAYYDITNLGYTLSSIWLFIALMKYDMMDSMQLAQEYVFDNMAQAVISVDIKGEITFSNKLANEVFPEILTNQKEVIEKLENAVANNSSYEWKDKIFQFEEQTLFQNGLNRGKIYILIDEAEHINYTTEIKKQKDEAEAANKSKSRFLSVVSHEIRTPMNAVVGMTDLLLKDDENLNDKQRKYLNNIKSSGQALVMIVNDILDQSKLEAGKMELIPAPYNLRALVEDVKLIIENRVAEKPIEVKCDIEEQVPAVLIGDSLRIRQIMINLMNNAVKFTEEGAVSLKISYLDTDGDRICLRFAVSDTGQGIKPEDECKLGEAFMQVDSSKNHFKEGTGLGLSISKDFINLMGGNLSVESEYGKGSEFYFSIWQGIGVEDGQCDIDEKKEKQYSGNVLVVDDTPINLMIAEEVLTPMGVEVNTSTSGGRALQMIKKKKYDVVFMDYKMPNMDGVEVITEIRALEQGYKIIGDDEMASYVKKLPIIALTGDTSEDAHEAFVRAGASGFTEKPIDPIQVRKVFDQWL